jgi:hypothetical protein
LRRSALRLLWEDSFFYDADYAFEVERYPGIVVHGPLIATRRTLLPYGWPESPSPGSGFEEKSRPLSINRHN